MTKKYKNPVLSLLLIAFSVFVYWIVPKDIDQDATVLSTESSQETYKVIKVVDGDTITASKDGINYKIRLLGINSPELSKGTTASQCYADEAKKEAQKYLNGQNVILENDPSQGDKDKYDRLLRYVYVQGNTNFNKLMIQNGCAFEYTYNKPYKYQKDFKQAELEAKNNKVGLWNSGNCAYIK
jgi:micrococcal nuclease